MNDAWLGLMSAAGGTPRLEGAVCRGRAEVFDLSLKADPELVEYATHLCRSCPALKPCEAWIAATAAHGRPAGVVAGQLLGPPPAPPRAGADDDQQWLADYLRRHGPTPAADVMIAGRNAGISPARLRAARRAVAAPPTGRGDREPWRLPAAAAAA